MDGPIYLRISPELRRSACYVLVSSLPLALICYWVSRFATDESIASAAFRSGLLLLLGMAMIVPLRWSLRLDDQGIARRFLFRWDLWPWADISSGRIEKRHPYMLLDPERPWWRRRLSLGFMASGDIGRTMELVNAHYLLPPPPKVPDSVEIKYGNFFRRSARLDAIGIHVHTRKEDRQYLWGEVARVHITRMDAVRRDFARLEIVLPDREIELALITHEYGTSPTWRGATAEIVNEVLVRHVPADRIDQDIRGERPARRIDVEKLLAKARERRRGPRRCMLMFMPPLVAILIWMAVMDSMLRAAFMTGMIAIFIVPLYIAVQWRLQSCCLELERQLASFDTSDSAVATSASQSQEQSTTM